MELDKCISKRRSIKSYKDKAVSFNLISKLIDAAHFAPSSGNLQNWRFVIVKDDKKRQDLARACLNQLWMTEAPIHIVICSDNSKLKTHYEKTTKKFMHENCAAAIQNLILKAFDLGLGTCWVGSINTTMVERVIEADEVDIIAVITVGYPAEKPISKRHKIEELTYFEKYGNRKRDEAYLFPLEKHSKKLEKSLSKIIKNKKG